MTHESPHKKRFNRSGPLIWGVALAGSALLLSAAGSALGAPPLNDNKIFAGKNGSVVTVRRTTNGVPHISARNLESAAFGSGYVQAQDNICILAETFVKARGERTKFFGPGENSFNIISDFSYKALGIRSGAAQEYPRLSAQSRALIQGYVAGYNKYLEETLPGELAPECRDQPWVRPIEPADLYAYHKIIAQYASGDLFATGALFAAVPPGVNPAPTPVIASGKVPQVQQLDVDWSTHVVAEAREQAVRKDFINTGLASNAWGIGKSMTENGRGALLSNPHFPYTGPRRLYQSHIKVPGVVDVTGAALMGMPTPLIGFNKNLGWSHTISTSRRFTVYQLTLKEGEPLTYVKDGEEKPITTKIIEIEVPDGAGGLGKLSKTFYYSEYGPMLAADAVTEGLLPAWGSQGTAYTYRDINADASGMLDTWLNMARAKNLRELQSNFEECGSTLWVNTTYADDKGNAYYIDSSSVPNLSRQALSVMATKLQSDPLYAGLFSTGLTLLDGSTSRDDWVNGKCGGRVPFADMPQLLRDDFVQNANNSFWATNPAQFLTGFSPLYGPEAAPLSARTRMGLKMLQNPTDPGFAGTAPAGQDGRLSALDLVNTIYNNRAWYAEELLNELLSRCQELGSEVVDLPSGGRSVAQGCNVLASWNGVYDTDSVGAHVFRVFMGTYRKGLETKLTVPFDPTDPVHTPRGPARGETLSSDPMLQALATGLNKLDEAGVAYNATLGSVQLYQPSGGVPPGFTPVELGEALPWHGGDGDVDGAFNALAVSPTNVAEDTLYPRIASSPIADTGGLSANADNPAQPGWLMARGTSWLFGLEFTQNGPRAFGLMTYSQSSDANSPFFNDQSERYSQKDYRPILFTEEEIAANVLPQGEVELRERSVSSPHRFSLLNTLEDLLRLFFRH